MPVLRPRFRWTPDQIWHGVLDQLTTTRALIFAVSLTVAPVVCGASSIEKRLNLKVLPTVTHLVSYPATSPPKGRVVVFSEPDCGPCMLFFRDIDRLNRRGYNVDVGFFIRDPSRRKEFEAVLCAANPSAAMVALYQRRNKRTAAQCGASVDDQREKAELMGGFASPFFVFENGASRHGYQGFDWLVAWLDEQSLVGMK